MPPAREGDVPGAVDQEITRRVLRYLRADDGQSQAALAAAAAIPPTSLSNYLKGKHRWPASTVASIARALGVSICELYGVEEGHSTRWDSQLLHGDQEGRVVQMFKAGGQAMQNSPAFREFVDKMEAATIQLRQRLRDEEGLP